MEKGDSQLDLFSVGLDTSSLNSESGSEPIAVDTVRAWFTAAKRLGKMSSYLGRIQFIGESMKRGKPFPEQYSVSLHRDIQQYRESLNNATRCAATILDRLGTTDGDARIYQGKVYALIEGDRGLTVATADRGTILDSSSDSCSDWKMTAADFEAFTRFAQKVEQMPVLVVQSDPLPELPDLWERFASTCHDSDVPAMLTEHVATAALQDGLEGDRLEALMRLDPEYARIVENLGSEYAEKYIHLAIGKARLNVEVNSSPAPKQAESKAVLEM